MNNIQSLSIIFWCFIVLITCCFSHHLRLNPREISGENILLLSKMTTLCRPPSLPSALCYGLLVSLSFFVFCFDGFSVFYAEVFLLSQFLLNYMSLSVEFIFSYTIKKCEHYMYYFYATFSNHSLSPWTNLRGGIVNCKDINTTTSAASHSADPSTFSDPIWPRSLSAEIFILWSALIAQFLSWVDQNVLNVASPFLPLPYVTVYFLSTASFTTTRSKMYTFHIYGTRQAAKSKHEQKKVSRRLYLVPHSCMLLDWRSLLSSAQKPLSIIQHLRRTKSSIKNLFW